VRLKNLKIQKKSIFYFFTFILFILFLINNKSLATPEFAQWTANRCSTCHNNMQGGGLRTEFGMNFSKDASILPLNKIGFSDSLNLTNKFDLLGSPFSVGTDLRFQLIRSFKTEDAQRRFIPMQASIYLGWSPLDWLTVDGQINIANKMFNGQKLWVSSLIIKPADYLPALRLGFFQPSFGVRDCDMTELDRRIAASDGTESLIAPDFAEYGAEFIYESFDWLTLNLGAFDSQSLAELSLYGEQVPLIPIEHNPSFNTRAIIYLQNINDFFPESFLEYSFLINGRFTYTTAMVSLSINNLLHLYGKYATSNFPYSRFTHNFLIGSSYIITKGLILGLRGEFGTTDLIFGDEINSIKLQQYVLNVKIFPFPFFEMIPEYRFMNTVEYKSTRWDLQFHFYY
jgi:hypothetical protein